MVTKIYKYYRFLAKPKNIEWAKKTAKRLKMSVSNISRIIYDVMGEMEEEKFDDLISKYK